MEWRRSSFDRSRPEKEGRRVQERKGRRRKKKEGDDGVTDIWGPSVSKRGNTGPHDCD
jgi:hypothetical protein